MKDELITPLFTYLIIYTILMISSSIYYIKLKYFDKEFRKLYSIFISHDFLQELTFRGFKEKKNFIDKDIVEYHKNGRVEEKNKIFNKFDLYRNKPLSKKSFEHLADLNKEYFNIDKISLNEMYFVPFFTGVNEPNQIVKIENKKSKDTKHDLFNLDNTFTLVPILLVENIIFIFCYKKWINNKLKQVEDILNKYVLTEDPSMNYKDSMVDIIKFCSIYEQIYGFKTIINIIDRNNNIFEDLEASREYLQDYLYNQLCTSDNLFKSSYRLLFV